MGNIWSVLSALRYLGGNPIVSNDPKEIARAETLFLPGVGSFRKAMNTLRENGLDHAILEAVQAKGAKILGICLGMQLMTKSSDEGVKGGLGWIDGKTIKFSFSLNSIDVRQVKQIQLK